MIRLCRSRRDIFVAAPGASPEAPSSDIVLLVLRVPLFLRLELAVSILLCGVSSNTGRSSPGLCDYSSAGFAGSFVLATRAMVLLHRWTSSSDLYSQPHPAKSSSVDTLQWYSTPNNIHSPATITFNFCLNVFYYILITFRDSGSLLNKIISFSTGNLL